MSSRRAHSRARRVLVTVALASLSFCVVGSAGPAQAQASPEDPPSIPLGAVFDGQSNTLSPNIGEGYPIRLMMETLPGVPFAVPAEGATSYAWRTETAPERVDHLAPMMDHAILFTEGGPSDIAVDRVSAPEVIERIRTYVAGRRAAGYDTVVSSTILPGTLYGELDAVRLEVNQLLREQYRDLGIDALADIAAVPSLQHPENRGIYMDGIHLTARGAAIVARTYESALADAGYVRCTSLLGLFEECRWRGL